MEDVPVSITEEQEVIPKHMSLPCDYLGPTSRAALSPTAPPQQRGSPTGSNTNTEKQSNFQLAIFYLHVFFFFFLKK